MPSPWIHENCQDHRMDRNDCSSASRRRERSRLEGLTTICQLQGKDQILPYGANKRKVIQEVQNHSTSIWILCFCLQGIVELLCIIGHQDIKKVLLDLGSLVFSRPSLPRLSRMGVGEVAIMSFGTTTSSCKVDARLTWESVCVCALNEQEKSMFLAHRYPGKMSGSIFFFPSCGFQNRAFPQNLEAILQLHVCLWLFCGVSDYFVLQRGRNTTIIRNKWGGQSRSWKSESN